MSTPGKPISDLGLDNLTDRLSDSLSCDSNKPDFKELDLGSPVSPLRTRPSGINPTVSTTTSSSSSSGSVSGRNVPKPAHKSGESRHSGEHSGSSDSSPTAGRTGSTIRNSKPNRQDLTGAVNSPPAPNILPTGNICPSGKIIKTGMATKTTRSDTLGSGTGNYGHGSIMRGSSAAGKSAGNVNNANSRGKEMGLKKTMMSSDPEELKRAGNEEYMKGRFAEALALYDKAITLSPGNTAYRSNRAAALTGLGRVGAAVRECEETLKLDPGYSRARHRLGSLLIRLGQVEAARRHLCYSGQQPDPEDLQKLQAVEKHLNKCSDARRIGDWKSALRECDAAIAAGGDFSPQLYACRAENLLKLHRLDDAECSLSDMPIVEPSNQSSLHAKFFGMLSEAYLAFVRAQIEMASGRFENAVIAAEKAEQIDSRSVEVAVLLNNVRLVSRARTRGNDLFKSERFTEACSAYGEGLRLDPSNSVLYCNRAACWFKTGQWERSVEDCNQALRIQPNYTKALLRRAASNSKLERWVDAVKDYEVLRMKLPNDNELAESLFHAQVALKKSRGEEVSNMKFGGEVEEISSLEQFKAAICSPGASVVHFKTPSNPQCRQISPFVDTLCGRYPSVNFLKVDIEQSPEIAQIENVRIAPTFKIYKNGSRVKEMICPSNQVLEYSVRHYSF